MRRPCPVVSSSERGSKVSRSCRSSSTLAAGATLGNLLSFGNKRKQSELHEIAVPSSGLCRLRNRWGRVFSAAARIADRQQRIGFPRCHRALWSGVNIAFPGQDDQSWMDGFLPFPRSQNIQRSRPRSIFLADNNARRCLAVLSGNLREQLERQGIYFQRSKGGNTSTLFAQKKRELFEHRSEVQLAVA